MASLAVITALPAQGQRVDYSTADRIRTFDPSLVGGRVYPVWLSDSVRFYYEALGGGAGRRTFYLVDPRVGTRQAVPDTASLVDRRGEGPPWAVRSTDKQWDAFVRNHDVYIRPARDSDAEIANWRAPRPSLDRTGCDAPSPPGAVVRRDSVSLPSGSVALTRGARGLVGFGFFRFGLEVAQVEAERFRLAPRQRLTTHARRAQRSELGGKRTWRRCVHELRT